MAVKVPVICPECAKHFQAPPEIIGRKIRCKNCGKAFIAKKAEDADLGQKKADAGIIPFEDDEDDGKPYEVTSLDMAPRCPSCANELTSEEDTICLHCGFNLQTRTTAETRHVKDVTGGDIFKHLLPGILAAVGFFLCLGSLIANIVEWILWDLTYNGEKMERWQINCTNCCVIWWCIFMIYLMWHSGKFAIKRLIFENKPPEVEI
jgi:hypothetical protein